MFQNHFHYWHILINNWLYVSWKNNIYTDWSDEIQVLIFFGIELFNCTRWMHCRWMPLPLLYSVCHSLASEVLWLSALSLWPQAVAHVLFSTQVQAFISILTNPFELFSHPLICSSFKRTMPVIFHVLAHLLQIIYFTVNHFVNHAAVFYKFECIFIV